MFNYVSGIPCVECRNEYFFDKCKEQCYEYELFIKITERLLIGL